MVEANVADFEPTVKETPAVAAPAVAAPGEGEDDTQLSTNLHRESGFTGDFGANDVQEGYLQLVSGNSKLAEKFLSGHWVASKEHDLGERVDVVFLSCDKHFEQAPLDEDLIDDPLTWTLYDEARRSGHKFFAVGDMRLLVGLPTDHPASDQCWFEFEGRAFLPQRYIVRGTKNNPHGGNYGTIVKTIFRDAEKGWLAKKPDDEQTGRVSGVSGGIYELYSTKESFANIDYRRARVQPNGVVSRELRELILDETGL